MEGPKRRAGTQMVSAMLRGLVLIPSIIRDEKVQCSFYFTPAKPLPLSMSNPRLKVAMWPFPRELTAGPSRDFQPQWKGKGECQREDKFQFHTGQSCSDSDGASEVFHFRSPWKYGTIL